MGERMEVFPKMFGMDNKNSNSEYSHHLDL
jgi:hypothetical protein